MAAKNTRLQINNECGGKKPWAAANKKTGQGYFVWTNFTCRARNRAKARIQAIVGTVALRRCCASGMLRRHLTTPVHSHLWRREKSVRTETDVKSWFQKKSQWVCLCCRKASLAVLYCSCSYTNMETRVCARACMCWVPLPWAYPLLMIN